jgi:PadR family transcriptional regulator PadR
MRTDELKNTILKTFRRGEFYGYDLHKRLDQERIEIGLSRLYRVLNEMEREDLLSSRWEKSTTGPRKKMYTIGVQGRKKLREILLGAIGTVHDFYGDYLISLYPEIRVFDDIFDWLTKGFIGNEKVAYLVTNNSAMHDMVIRSLSQRVTQGRIYVIASKNVTRELKIDTGALLRGDHDNIPLRDGFLDMIICIDLPQIDLLRETFDELSRVLNDDGKMGVITPSILLQEHEDPLTIGDFIEKYEHEVIERREHIEKEFLLALMKNKFKKTEEKELVHLTLLLASEPQNPSREPLGRD